MNMEEKSIFYPSKYVIRGIGVSIITLLIKLLTSGLVFVIYTGTRGEFSFMPEWAVHLIIFIGLILMGQIIKPI